MKFALCFLQVFFVDLLHAGSVLIGLCLMIGLVGYGIGRAEGWSGLDTVYHAFMNATTVGYGDFRPQKNSSKMLAILLAFVGLILFGIVVAIAFHAADYAYEQVYGASGLAGRTGGPD